MRRLTPQEKKALSYEKDRRNAYGENDKSSRKAIPLRKRLVNRANRSQEKLLSTATGTPDPDVADVAEQRLLGRRPKSWRKMPDEPLGDRVRRRLSRHTEQAGATQAEPDEL